MLESRSRILGGLFACAMLVGCGIESSESNTLDIFTADAQGKRRRAATNAEKLWTVSMGGCTGALLTPEYFLTAHHCNPQPGARFTSGSALVSGKRSDLTLVSIVESNAQMDYLIGKVKWSGEFPKDQKLPPLVATKADDFKYSAKPDQGDEIFTVGFPADQNQRATYAEGRAKILEGDKLLYNIGTINGNSGGSVWRKSDNMLISMTNAGPNQFGDNKWNARNSKDDRNHWNNGVALHFVYKRSKVLQALFPGGKNKALNEDGSIKTDAIEVPESEQEPLDPPMDFEGTGPGPSQGGALDPRQNDHGSFPRDQGDQDLPPMPMDQGTPSNQGPPPPPPGAIIYYP